MSKKIKPLSVLLPEELMDEIDRDPFTQTTSRSDFVRLVLTKHFREDTQEEKNEANKNLQKAE